MRVHHTCEKLEVGVRVWVQLRSIGEIHPDKANLRGPENMMDPIGRVSRKKLALTIVTAEVKTFSDDSNKAA